MPATMSWRLPSACTAITPDETAPTSGKSRAGPTATSLVTFASGGPDGAGFRSGPALGSALAAADADGVDTSGVPRKQESAAATQPAASHVAALVWKPLRILTSKQ